MNQNLVNAANSIANAQEDFDALSNDLSLLAEKVISLSAENTSLKTEVSDLKIRLARLSESEVQKMVSIQVFPDRDDLSYRDHERILELLGGLGIKRVRGNLSPQSSTDTRVLKFYQDAYNRFGIKSWLTIGRPRITLTTSDWDSIQAAIEGPLQGMVARVDGWNEPSHNRGGTSEPTTDWEKKTGIHQAELWRRFGGKIPVGSMQMWSGVLATHDTQLKAVAPYVMANGKPMFDTIVWHLYQTGEVPFNRYKTLYNSLFGDLPIVCSETGMSTAPNQISGAASMDEAGQAEYIKTHIGMYLSKGCAVNWFELHDEPDPAGTDREDWLGIVRFDGTPKPAYTALKNLLAST